MNDRFDSSQWQRLGSLFSQAISLNAAGKKELLLKIEGEDADLAQELATLLAADAKLGDHSIEHFKRVLQDSLAAIEAPTVALGDRVGPYVLREELGQGGMGVVFRAERVDGQVQQQVAIKIVKRAVLDASERKRFLREREIVATFQHPYIARLLDVGQTADGSPYLAMELVRGLPITGHCDALRLDARHRIEVFLRVCEAVQHSHANLVLHRDLKPSNVLVGEDGLPKLIDFGIAKLLTIMVDNERDRTATTRRFFSPGNVAPEQLRGERIGVACDVYQLGTLLHELLCGGNVFDTEGLTPGQFEKRILEAAPEPPSQRATRAREATAKAHGAATAAALARELRGDLDAVVALALRKLPKERYGSVEQFMDDLRRYLDGRPVAAVRGRHWYRARKFVRRNALALGLSIAAFVLVAAIAVQSQRVARERDLARQERDHAEHVVTFLADVFRSTDPGESLSRDQPIGTVLDNARNRLAWDMGEEPGLQVRMLTVLSGVYENLDDHDTALSLLDQARRILYQAHSVDPRIVLDYDLQHAQLMQESGNRRAQRNYANQALTLQRALGDSPGKQWEARVLLTDSFHEEGTTTGIEAMKLLLDQLAHDPDVPAVEYAEELVQLGKEYAGANDTVDAELLVRQGLDSLASKVPTDHPYVRDAKRILATLLEPNHHQGEAGVAILKDVIAHENRLYVVPSSSVALSLIALGKVYSQLHRRDDAIAATQSGCDILYEIHARPQQDLIRCLAALAGLHELDGKPELAAANYAEAQHLAGIIEGADNIAALKMGGELGRIRMEQGRLAEADGLFSAIDHALDRQAPDAAGLVIYHADVLHRLHRDTEAVAELDSIEPLLKKYPDRLHAKVVAAASLRKQIVVGK